MRFLGVATAALLVAVATPAPAAPRGGASGFSPGHEMQAKPLSGSPGASGYAPGHIMHRTGMSASHFAPGRRFKARH